MRVSSIKFLGNRLRPIHLILIFIFLLNFSFGLFVFTSIISKINPTEADEYNRLQQEKQSPFEKSLNKTYQYYFRIDYTIIEGLCIPIKIFNTSQNLLAIENLTKSKLKLLFRRNLDVEIEIISFDFIAKKSDKLFENSIDKPSCDYIIKLQIGLSFPSSCTKDCRLKQISYLTCNIRPFGYRLNNSFVLILYKNDLSNSRIDFYISRMLMFESSIYKDKLVYIRSYYENIYFYVLVLDADGSQLSLTMSDQYKSIFQIKDGLYKNSTKFLKKKTSVKKKDKNFDRDELNEGPIEIINHHKLYKNKSDCSSNYISLLSKSISNSYIQNHHGRITVKKHGLANSFKQDASFNLIFSKKYQDMIAFKAVNVEDAYISIDPITPKGLILSQVNSSLDDIHLFDDQFLFKFILI